MMKFEDSQRDVNDGNLPVFVFPSSLDFYVNDASSHKQVLTLYNPYEFTVLFKVLCNNPKKYNVVEAEGCIESKCCIDIVIRVLDYQQVFRREDKFRIHLYELGLPKLLGKKDIPAVLSEKGDHDIITSYSQKPASVPHNVENIRLEHKKETITMQRSLPSFPDLLVMIACSVALMLPLDNDDVIDPNIPELFHLSINQKLIAAFVLGLVTMAILKP